MRLSSAGKNPAATNAVRATSSCSNSANWIDLYKSGFFGKKTKACITQIEDILKTPKSLGKLECGFCNHTNDNHAYPTRHLEGRN